MWATIIAFCLVVVMVVGPIMMIQPSRRQRRVARLRELAATRQLRVKLSSNPVSGEPRQLCVYSHAVETTSHKDKLRPWMLARQSFEHELNFVADWDWVGRNRVAEGKQRELCEWVQMLPAPIRAVEVTEHSVSLYWTEACWHREARWQDSIELCLNFIEHELNWLAQMAD
ncbi:hypothetical protein [Teredinibacter haidensis]|uniref:hypothetical protein n=1 Tax=Teredinibacter haidensis TaxID=2731755 RepID=UPI000948DB9B|nr:hypothetical protein [Teredinibacter haidensis]